MRGLLVAVLIVMAGCATQAPEPVPDAQPYDVAPPPEPWALDLDNCVGVAGVSVYPRDQYSASAAAPPEPFVPADIRGDIGSARVASANGAGWLTAPGEVAGHWHFAFDCAQFGWGFVGIAIEAPAFDEAPVERNFLLAVWSFPDAVAKSMHHVGHATTALDVSVELDGTTMQMLLRDTDHGRYEGIAPRGGYIGATEAETIRFWMLMPTEGHPNHHDQVGPYEPVAFDLHANGFSREVPLDSVGLFAHTETDHHAPLPGLGGNDVAVAWHGLEGRIMEGPRPDVRLDETWVH